MRIPTVAFAIVLGGALLSTTAVSGQVSGSGIPGLGPWGPDEFQFFCGTPLYRHMALNNIPQTAFWPPDHYRRYRDSLGIERDVADPGCLPDSVLTQLETMASQAFQEYRQLSGLADPAPNRLSPVVLEGGRAKVRMYVDPTTTGIGGTHTMSHGSGVADYPISAVHFTKQWVTHSDPGMVYRIIAHELGHVIQNAQPYVQDGSGIRGATAALWVNEGANDATAASWMWKRYPAYRPPLSVRGSRSVYGLRPYHRAFTWESAASDVDRHGHPLVTPYTTSSFWTYLAERFFGGSFDYLGRFWDLTQDEASRLPDPCTPDDWLCWLDNLLRDDTGGIDQPFYLVFPDFIATYAAWGEKKYPHLQTYSSAPQGEDLWLDESFGGCQRVRLSPQGSAAVHSLTLDLEPISARCVKVEVTGLATGQLAAVQWMAYDTDEDRLDNLHLVASRMGGLVYPFRRNFDCWDESQLLSTPMFGACGRKPFTGTRGDVQASGGEFAKTWLGETQESDGSPIENVYFIVHTPVYPRDARHDPMQFVGPTLPGTNSLQQTVRLQVGLDTTVGN